jgi:hypothetical protein
MTRPSKRVIFQDSIPQNHGVACCMLNARTRRMMPDVMIDIPRKRVRIVAARIGFSKVRSPATV